MFRVQQVIAPPVARFVANPSKTSATILAFKMNASRAAVQEPAPLKQETTNAVDYSALIVRVAEERDRKAFIHLHQYFSPRVKSFLIGQRVPADEADDVLQEVMLAVWNKAHLFKPEKAAASTWIFAIARNKRIDRIRKNASAVLDPEDPSLQPAQLENGDQSLLGSQRKDAIRDALMALPEDQRRVVELSFMKGLSHSEISDQLELPLGTVKSRIRLAFQRLRGELGDLL